MAPSFTVFLALTLSLFALVNALPTIKNPAPAAIAEIAGPRSLLGRRYVRQTAVNSAPRAAREYDIIARDGPSRRADRFRAVQRRIARNPASERIVEHDENLLSNQSLMAPPPASGTPTQVPTSTGVFTPQAHLDAPNTSVTLIPRPTPSAHAKKHSKSGEKKAGGKVAKKT